MKSLHKTYLSIILWAVILMGSPSQCNAQTSNIDELRSIFSSNDIDSISPWELNKPVLLSFDLGKQALPFLETMLLQSDKTKSYLAAYSIAVIGGTKSADILKKAYNKKQDIGFKTLLCFSLASTGRKTDIGFLVRALHGEHIGDEGPPIQQAAFSLGVLRAKEAKSALQKTASKQSGFASEAADYALSWLNGDMWDTDMRENTITDSIIYSLFRFGIPRLDESTAFVEKASNRIWYRKGKNWTHEPLTDSITDKVPSISFQTHVTQDEMRAICSVGLLFGPLNGSGYDIILKKRDGIWKVIGIMQTWVS